MLSELVQSHRAGAGNGENEEQAGGRGKLRHQSHKASFLGMTRMSRVRTKGDAVFGLAYCLKGLEDCEVGSCGALAKAMRVKVMALATLMNRLLSG